MEYKKFNNMYVVRLDVGDEILGSIKEFVIKENIKLAKIEAIGATNNFVVGAYDLASKKYHEKEYNGAYEIVSLMGNITTMNGECYTHLHMSCAKDDNIVVGGHLLKAYISITCEIFVTCIDGDVDRKKDMQDSVNKISFE